MKILHIGNLKSGIDTYVRNTVALASDKFEFVIVMVRMITVNLICVMASRLRRIALICIVP